jgi:hypothetical protein
MVQFGQFSDGSFHDVCRAVSLVSVQFGKQRIAPSALRPIGKTAAAVVWMIPATLVAILAAGGRQR